MAWHFSVYLLPGFLAGIVSAAVAAFAWRHRGERTGRPFSVLMAAIAWWALAYGVELGYTDASSVLLWDRVAFVGSVVVPAALFWLAVEYAGLEARVPSWTPLLLAVEPLATLALVWSYPRTHLVWTAVDVEHVHGISLPVLDFGPWYWVNYAYSYLLIAAALLVIASVFVRGSRIYRRQSALLILGAVVPLGANVLYNVLPAVSPLPALDLTTSALAVTGILYGLALFHFRMLDLAPVARGMLLRRIGDGFVVVTDDGALVEGNDVGRRIVAHDRTGFDTALAAGPDASDLDGTVVSTPGDDRERTYELRTEPVTDFRDERVGTMVLFRDITELEIVRRQQQRLSVMNRVLRHNIRNDMTVIGGFAGILAESLTDPEREYARTIQDRADRLTAIGEKARHIGDPNGYTGRTGVDVAPVVRTVVDRARSEYPDAALSLDAPDAATALVSTERDLRAAVDYLVENAVEHNDTTNPTVAVTVERNDREVRVAVADDGPGIPAAERDVLTADTEKPLEHGSGLGLWVVHWLVSRSGGTLDFSANEPRGSVVTITLNADE